MSGKRGSLSMGIGGDIEIHDHGWLAIARMTDMDLRRDPKRRQKLNKGVQPRIGVRGVQEPRHSLPAASHALGERGVGQAELLAQGIEHKDHLELDIGLVECRGELRVAHSLVQSLMNPTHRSSLCRRNAECVLPCQGRSD
jgi:hypothetical protein